MSFIHPHCSTCSRFIAVSPAQVRSIRRPKWSHLLQQHGDVTTETAWLQACRSQLQRHGGQTQQKPSAEVNHSWHLLLEGLPEMLRAQPVPIFKILSLMASHLSQGSPPVRQIWDLSHKRLRPYPSFIHPLILVRKSICPSANSPSFT